MDSWAKDILDWTIEGVLETFHNHTWFAQVIPRDFIGRDDYSPKQVFGDIVTYDEDEDETDEVLPNHCCPLATRCAELGFFLSQIAGT